MARRRIVLFALVVVFAIFLAVRRPWDRPVQPAVPPNIDMTKMATLQCVIASGEPCTVTFEGQSGSTLSRFTFNFKDVTKSITQHAEAPLTLQAIIIKRLGKSHWQEMRVTIPAGQSREIKINADDSIEVVSP